MNIGNFQVKSPTEFVYLPEDKDYSNTIKLTWLPNVENQKITMKYFGHLITKAILEPDDDFKNYVNPNSIRVFHGFV